MKLLGVGIAVGLALGFLLSTLLRGNPVTSDDPPRSPERTIENAVSPIDSKPASPDQVVKQPSGPDHLTVFRTGSTEAIRRILGGEKTGYSAEEVAALIARADEARALRDWNLFSAALGGLGAAGTRAADEKLLSLINDETLTFKHRMGTTFLEYLGDSEIPGIAAAARNRFLRTVESGETSWVAADGWMGLILRQGGPDDVTWMLSLTKSGGIGNAGSGQITQQVFEALAQSDQPTAVEGLANLAREARLQKYVLDDFARNHPEAAYTAIREAMDARPDDTDFRGDVPRNRDLLQAFALSAPEDRVQEAKDYLLGISDEGLKIEAVYDVQIFHRRGLDISGLSSIVDAPVEYLERTTPPGRPKHLYAAMYAVEYNRVAWSERAAQAFSEAARRFPEHSCAKDLVENAKMIRAGLNEPWR